MRPARGVLVATVATLVLRASVAHADDESDARDAMRRGVAAFARGDANAALAEYETAKRLVPTANAPYRFAAEALASLGRWPDVVSNLEQYIAKNPNVSDAEDTRARIAKVKAEHYPAKVRVESNVPTAHVAIDGADKGTPGVFEVAAGKHRIELSAPGKTTRTEDVTLVGDRETPLTIDLVDAPPPVIPPEGDRATPPPPADDAVPWRTIGWVGVGVGAATFLTSLVIDNAVLAGKIDDYDTAADRGDPSARGLHDDVATLRTGILVGYVAGAVIGAAGGALVLFAPRAKPSTTAITPAMGAGYAGVSARIAF